MYLTNNARLATRLTHEQFTICRIVDGQPVAVSRHWTQYDAETAMLALGERYPCGGERYLILRQLEAGSR